MSKKSREQKKKDYEISHWPFPYEEYKKWLESFSPESWSFKTKKVLIAPNDNWAPNFKEKDGLVSYRELDEAVLWLVPVVEDLLRRLDDADQRNSELHADNAFLRDVIAASVSDE